MKKINLLKLGFQNLLFLFVYLVIAKVGLEFATINAAATPIWPATGLGIASAYLFGRRFWVAIWLGALLANLSTETIAWTALPISVGNFTEAILGAYILKYVRGYFDRFRHLTQTIAYLVTSLIAPLPSATFGALSLCVFSVADWSEFGLVWVTWWIGNVLGSLFVAPLTISAFNKTWKNTFSLKNLVKTIFVALVIAATLLFVFFHPEGKPFLFLCFPLLMLALVCLGNVGAKICSLLIGVVYVNSVVSALSGINSSLINEALIYCQVFLSIVAVTCLVLIGLQKTVSFRLPALVILACWLISGSLYYAFSKNEMNKDENRFNEIVKSTQEAIVHRMATHEDALRGGRSLLSTFGKLTQRDWEAYVKNYQVVERYPGIMGLGIIAQVKHEDLKKFESDIRKTTNPSFQLQRVPGHRSIEENGDDYHYIVTFIEPLEKTHTALGLDISSEDKRYEAAMRARDSGRAAMTSKIELFKQNQEGFLLLLPMYSVDDPQSIEERRASFKGWVFAPFETNQFLDGVVKKEAKEVEVYIFDGNKISKENLIYSSKKQNKIPTSFERVTHLSLAQHNFTLGWRRSHFFLSKYDLSVALVGFVGAMFSLLLAGLVASLQEITSRSQQLADQTTKLLKMNESRFKRMVESNLIGFLYCSVDGTILEANQAFLDMVGYSRKDLEERALNWRTMTPPEYRFVDDEALRALSEAKVNPPAEKEYYRKDGSRVSVVFSAALVEEEEGRAMAFIIDNSARKSREAQIIQAREIALEAARTKSEFLANMSHEIRTPINGIVGMCSLLSETQLSNVQKDYLESINHSAEGLLTIVNDILDFSKIEANRVELEKIPFKLADLIRDVERSFTYLAKQKGIDFKVTLSSDTNDSQYLVGDPGRIRQVLANLVSNAIKFTDHGFVHLKAIEKSSQTQSDLRFEVLDSGIGIPKRARGKMFKAFSQADSSTNRRFGGTGLGLSISKNLVQLMEGKIDAESEEGKGSCFWFTISLPRLHQKTDETQTIAKPTAKSSRVLVAEDNPISQKVAVEILNNLGFNAEAVANGIDLLEALAKAKYDLVLMDCQMPGMDGYEATLQIRKTNPTIPIIAMTANAIAGDKERCLEVGMNDYLAKPVRPKALLEMIEKWLRVKESSVDDFIDMKIMRSLQSIAKTSNPNLIGELANMFLELYPKSIEAMKAHLEKNQFSEVKKLAHSLKSCSGNIGLKKVVLACQNIEDETAELGGLIAELEAEISRCIGYLRGLDGQKGFSQF